MVSILVEVPELPYGDKTSSFFGFRIGSCQRGRSRLMLVTEQTYTADEGTIYWNNSTGLCRWLD